MNNITNIIGRWKLYMNYRYAENKIGNLRNKLRCNALRQHISK